METCRLIEGMLSGYLDGELTQQDRQRVEVHVGTCADCAKTLAELERLRQGIGDLAPPEPTDEQWSRMMRITVTKTSRGLGWLLGIGGYLILAGYAAYAFAKDDTVDTVLKVGVVGLVAGIGLLLFSVLIERLRARKSDRYKDVEL